MKKINYIFILLVGIVFFSSCEKNDREVDLISGGKNFTIFQKTKQAATVVADGSEVPVSVQIKIEGPQMDALKGDVTVQIAADQSMIDSKDAAIEGTHFRLGDAIVLKASNNYLGLYEFKMLTSGVPSPESKKLALVTSSATGDNMVSNSGKPIIVTLNYACPSALAGSYHVSTVYTAVDGTVATLTWDEAITETDVSTYRTARVGHWTPAQLNGTPGFTFTDLCGGLTVPQQNLVDLYSNLVTGTKVGEVDETTGVLKIEYSICSGDDCRYYVSTYTPF